jgi:hypothetical protein
MNFKVNFVSDTGYYHSMVASFVSLVEYHDL